MEHTSHTAIEQMIQSIRLKGQEENNTFYDTEKEALTLRVNQEIALLKKETDNRLERYKKRIALEYEQKMQREQLIFNQTISKEKRQYIDQIFVSVKKVVSQWTNTEMQTVMRAVFEHNKLSGEVAVQCGEYAEAALTQDFLNDCAAKHGSIRYQLVKPVILKDGGFILLQDGIEYNYLLSSLLAHIREEKQPELMMHLFESGGTIDETT